MPAKGTHKRDPLDRLVKTRLTEDQATALAELAKSCQMTRARYVRQLIEGALSGAVQYPKPRRRGLRDREHLARAINALGLQAKKLGNNVNQLARQANTGLVPVKRSEIVYTLNQLQLLTSAARTALERVLL
jgi:Bacterial mobilisation protein (MobC)